MREDRARLLSGAGGSGCWRLPPFGQAVLHRAPAAGIHRAQRLIAALSVSCAARLLLIAAAVVHLLVSCVLVDKSYVADAVPPHVAASAAAAAAVVLIEFL